MRLVMLGIDAAEHTLIDSLIARGRMRALARLRRTGTSGLLQSPADLYSGAVWPTFHTGQRPAWHGIYHNKLWQPHRMCCIVPDESSYRVRPFWERFGPGV
ncbi:MAG TPA: alkaline phosphatase family protein, partial [Steroidobacteraceae bacterium]|nr:alkaline phosphatase family protein [Steroidobacteraceae bacterium]